MLSFKSLKDFFSDRKRTQIGNIYQEFKVDKHLPAIHFKGRVPTDTILLIINGTNLTTGQEYQCYVRNPSGLLVERERVEVYCSNKYSTEAKFIKGFTSGITIRASHPNRFHPALYKRTIVSLLEKVMRKDKQLTGFIGQHVWIPIQSLKYDYMQVIRSVGFVLPLAKAILNALKYRIYPAGIYTYEYDQPLCFTPDSIHKFILRTEQGEYYAVDYQGQVALPLESNKKVTVIGKLIEKDKVVIAKDIRILNVSISLKKQLNYSLWSKDFRNCEKFGGRVLSSAISYFNFPEIKKWLSKVNSKFNKHFINIYNEYSREKFTRYFGLPVYTLELKISDNEIKVVLFRPTWFSDKSTPDIFKKLVPFPTIEVNDSIVVEASPNKSGIYLASSVSLQLPLVNSLATLDGELPAWRDVEEELIVEGAIISEPKTVVFGFEDEKLMFNLAPDGMSDLVFPKQVIFRLRTRESKIISVSVPFYVVNGRDKNMPIPIRTYQRIRLYGFFHSNGVFKSKTMEMLNE